MRAILLDVKPTSEGTEVRVFIPRKCRAAPCVIDTTGEVVDDEPPLSNVVSMVGRTREAA